MKLIHPPLCLMNLSILKGLWKVISTPHSPSSILPRFPYTARDLDEDQRARGWCFLEKTPTFLKAAWGRGELIGSRVSGISWRHLLPARSSIMCSTATTVNIALMIWQTPLFLCANIWKDNQHKRRPRYKKSIGRRVRGCWWSLYGCRLLHRKLVIDEEEPDECEGSRGSRGDPRDPNCGIFSSFAFSGIGFMIEGSWSWCCIPNSSLVLALTLVCRLSPYFFGASDSFASYKLDLVRCFTQGAGSFCVFLEGYASISTLHLLPGSSPVVEWLPMTGINRKKKLISRHFQASWPFVLVALNCCCPLAVLQGGLTTGLEPLEAGISISSHGSLSFALPISWYSEQLCRSIQVLWICGESQKKQTETIFEYWEPALGLVNPALR